MKIENLKRVIVLLLITIMTLSLNSFAATTGSFSTSISSKELNKGESVSVSVTTTNCAGQFTISSSDSSVASVNTSSIWVEGTTTFSISAKSAGNATISITASDVGDNQSSSEEVTGTRTISIKVVDPTPDPEPETPTTPTTPSEPESGNEEIPGTTTPEPETPPTQEPEKPTEPEPEKPTEPEPEKPAEPNFTSANKTMYASGDINLRDSWTTVSNATKIEEGTELTVTATSSNTVNGYVWYRVSYNGATKYVAGYLLTDKKPEEEKSNNANLKSLTVEGQEFLPEFSSDVTSYSMNVKTEVEKLDIKAQAEDEKATVDIKGNTELKDGENTVTISVSAEDGTVKIYEIKVTRADEIPLGLKTLKIDGTNIAKTFKSDVYEYEIDVENLDMLEIEAVANDEKATVEILGNEGLQEGENLITIIVKSEDGKETVTYQITVNKKIVVNEEPQATSNNTQIYIYIGIIVVAGAALVGVLIYFIKNRNKGQYYYVHSDYEDEEDFEGFPEQLPEKKSNPFYNENEDFSEDGDDIFKKKGKHF